MGAWGNGVWQDDAAVDLTIAFEDLVQGGLTVSAALQRVLDDPPWGWNDEEDSAVQLLAIAALALQHGLLDAALRDRAISVIDSEVPLWRWEGMPFELISARQSVLAAFRAILLTGSATVEELTAVTTPQPYSLW